MSTFSFRYFLMLADWHPSAVTPFQGLAPGLLDHAATLQKLIQLPGDVFEWIMPPADRLARRIGGVGGWSWLPMNTSTLSHVNTDMIGPLIVMFSAEPEVAQLVEQWRAQQSGLILHVGLNETQVDVPLDELSPKHLADYARAALREASRQHPELHFQEELSALDRWAAPTPHPSPLTNASHNVSLPNELVLMSEGAEHSQGTRFYEAQAETGPDDAPYQRAISESALSILAMRESAGEPEAFRVDPPRPSLFLYAPAMYKGLESSFAAARHRMPAGFEGALRKIARQRTFAFPGTPELFSSPAFRGLMMLRKRELVMQASGLGVRCASTCAAAIRLSPSVNRTTGAVQHLAQHLRNRQGPRPKKTARVFRLVQEALAAALPQDQIEILRRAVHGIKIFGDAPLEWLMLDGLPLCLRHDVSRINATPATLTFGELPNRPTLYLTPQAFQEFLVISSFDLSDPEDAAIAAFLPQALTALTQATGIQISVRYVTVNSRNELVAALNAYDGEMVVFDMHGEHAGEVGGLRVGSEILDVWSLRTEVRVPPIVILSACDTHPPDRSHASVANGMLYCGARTVLATLLPIKADKAALLIAKLALRAVEYTSAHISGGRSVSWSKVIGGLMRMQMVSELIFELARTDRIPLGDISALNMVGNMGINSDNPRWFEEFSIAVKTSANLSDDEWTALFSDFIAASDVIRYAQLGNPETIVVTSPALVQAVRG